MREGFVGVSFDGHGTRYARLHETMFDGPYPIEHLGAVNSEFGRDAEMTILAEMRDLAVFFLLSWRYNILYSVLR